MYADDWRTEASLNIPATGIIESVIPPALHFEPFNTNQGLDFKLLGPDGKPRAFELFWKEPSGPGRYQLTPDKIELDADKKGFIWEGPCPPKFITAQIQVKIARHNFVGLLDVKALKPNDPIKWHPLASNAALYQSSGYTRADVKLPKAQYTRIRLFFKGYDQHFDSTPLPVKSVMVLGKSIDRDYARTKIVPEFEVVPLEDITEIRIKLPGSGLWIENLVMNSGAQFQGQWQAGWESIIAGERKFRPMFSGTSIGVNQQTKLGLKIKQRWSGNSLIIRLDSHKRYFGPIHSIEVNCRVPRLLFFADQAGIYTARSGSGSLAKCFPSQKQPELKVAYTPIFSKVQKNTNFKPENLVKKFNIRGGPFNISDYQWQALVKVNNSGYFNLVLNQEAGLANQTSFRLVHNHKQVPYFRGRILFRKTRPKILEEYDSIHNRTNWTITLPAASSQWHSLDLTAHGIFQRQVTLKVHEHGRWKVWRTRTWAHTKNSPAFFSIALHGLKSKQTKIQIQIPHGDNHPLKITDLKVKYRTRDLYFLASAPGDYYLMGGNPKSRSASYDLALIQDHLFQTMAVPLTMEKLTRLQPPGLQVEFQEIFTNQGWGLYAVLGLVTLILAGLIVILFPKTQT